MFLEKWAPRATNATSENLKGNTKKLFEYLKQFEGTFPKIRDIQEGVGFSSPSMVITHLNKLISIIVFYNTIMDILGLKVTSVKSC